MISDLFKETLSKIEFTLRGEYSRITHQGIVPLTVIKEYLSETPEVLEAGAHTGKDTIAMANMWEQGHIHAFEPVPELFDKLARRVKKSSYNNITIYNLALGESDGVQNMYISSGASDGSSSLLEPKDHLINFPQISFNKQQPVRVYTLDSWAYTRGITKIDFMWLDLQGMELPVLKSGKTVLNSTTVIYAEVSNAEGYKKQTRYTDLKNWLTGEGFTAKVEAVTNGEGNVLFIRE